MNLDKLGSWTKALVSFSVLLAFFAMLGALIGLALRDKDFPPGVKETLLVLVGILAGSFKDTVGYWIGSSHGSERKTELMASTGETK